MERDYQEEVEAAAKEYEPLAQECVNLLARAEADSVLSLDSSEVITLIRRLSTAAQRYHAAMIGLINQLSLDDNATEALAEQRQRLRHFELRSKQLLLRLDNLCTQFSQAVIDRYPL